MTSKTSFSYFPYKNDICNKDAFRPGVVAEVFGTSTTLFEWMYVVVKPLNSGPLKKKQPLNKGQVITMQALF